MSAWWPKTSDMRRDMIETIRNEARLCARYTGRPGLSERVLDVMAQLPRHHFVPAAIRCAAYDNAALSAGHGQTISQPFIVALMTDLLDLTGSQRVLEIGTGTGYQTAILAQLATEVFSIERIPALADAAEKRLAALGLMERVQLRTGNGWHGWSEQAPFDAMIVTAAPERIPEALPAQLTAGGRLVIPVGPAGCTQQLLRVQKTATGELEIRDILPVVFVPLLPPAG